MAGAPDSPSISIVIPLYNAERYIGEAIESVLAQTQPVSEIIVVDDGSEDRGAAVARKYDRVRLLAKAHTGIGDTLNAGISVASGRFIAFLDADDLWTREKLSLQLSVLEGVSPVDLVFGHARIFRSVAGADGAGEEIIPGLGRGCLFSRRAVFDRVGAFTTDAKAHEFLDWYARAAELGLRSHMLPEVVYHRRIHGANEGILRRENQRAQTMVTLRAMLERRRGRAGMPLDKQ